MNTLFEAESDPFEKAELQTIDDLQELAAVLQTTATSTFPTSSSAAVYSTPSMMNAPAGAGVGVQGIFFGILKMFSNLVAVLQISSSCTFPTSSSTAVYSKPSLVYKVLFLNGSILKINLFQELVAVF